MLVSGKKVSSVLYFSEICENWKILKLWTK